MDAAEIERIVRELPRLTGAQLRRLATAVDQTIQRREVEAIVEGDGDERPSCPRCQYRRTVRWGVANGNQRWRCPDCSKTFNKLSGTPLAYSKKPEQMFAVARNMVGDQPRSCRKLADELGVHWMTVWRWRMKALRTLEAYGDGQLAGLVEADETFFRESRKGSREWAKHRDGEGPQPPRPRWRDFDKKKAKLPRGLSRWQIPVLVLRDRHGGTRATKLVGLDLSAFEPVLDQALATDAILCTDGAAIYRRYGAKRGRVVEQVNTRQGIRTRGAIHIQNANAFHARFKEFMRPFRGPSARYLPLYVGWMVFRDRRPPGAVEGNPLIERLTP
jgi:transposase-like protein